MQYLRRIRERTDTILKDQHQALSAQHNYRPTAWFALSVLRFVHQHLGISSGYLSTGSTPCGAWVAGVQ